MTPDEFVKAVADLAAENEFILLDLTFNSAGREAGGTHSYVDISVATMEKQFGVFLIPERGN